MLTLRVVFGWCRVVHCPHLEVLCSCVLLLHCDRLQDRLDAAALEYKAERAKMAEEEIIAMEVRHTRQRQDALLGWCGSTSSPYRWLCLLCGLFGAILCFLLVYCVLAQCRRAKVTEWHQESAWLVCGFVCTVLVL